MNCELPNELLLLLQAAELDPCACVGIEALGGGAYPSVPHASAAWLDATAPPAARYGYYLQAVGQSD